MSELQGKARIEELRRQYRLARAREFRSLYLTLGYTTSSLATFLHVSARTVHRWKSNGDAPETVWKLLRWASWRELPSRDWEGWHFSRNTLWSPEGHGFGPKDFSWLSLTIRKAEMFGVLYKERSELLKKVQQLQRDLSQSQQEALTAQSHAGLVELALRGWMAGASNDSKVSGRPGARAARALRENPTPVGEVQVTPHQLLNFEQSSLSQGVRHEV